MWGISFGFPLPIILLYLVLCPYFVYLRILPCVYSRASLSQGGFWSGGLWVGLPFWPPRNFSVHSQEDFLDLENEEYVVFYLLSGQSSAPFSLLLFWSMGSQRTNWLLSLGPLLSLVLEGVYSFTSSLTSALLGLLKPHLRWRKSLLSWFPGCCPRSLKGRQLLGCMLPCGLICSACLLLVLCISLLPTAKETLSNEHNHLSPGYRACRFCPRPGHSGSERLVFSVPHMGNFDSCSLLKGRAPGLETPPPEMHPQKCLQVCLDYKLSFLVSFWWGLA